MIEHVSEVGTVTCSIGVVPDESSEREGGGYMYMYDRGVIQVLYTGVIQVLYSRRVPRVIQYMLCQ